jgi:TatA/E family protein of Tat protein translocase
VLHRHTGCGQVLVDLFLAKGLYFLRHPIKRIETMFGNIGFTELLIILALALLIFGPKKLPEIGKSIGRALREFRKTSDEIKDKIEEEIHAEEFKSIKEEIEKDVKDDEKGEKIS